MYASRSRTNKNSHPERREGPAFPAGERNQFLRFVQIPYGFTTVRASVRLARATVGFSNVPVTFHDCSSPRVT